jgi:REP element-mobilizing transposase RayT
MKTITRSRKSLRLPDWDYSQPGAYFVTVITRQRECLFGEIVNGKMKLNEAGQIVWDVWKSLPARYPYIAADEAVVMPNHFHGIIIVKEYPPVSVTAAPVRAVHELPLQERLKERRRMTIPLVLGYFKMNSAKKINILLQSPGVPVWQRNYYERIIRESPVREIHEFPVQGIDQVRLYIRLNPERWLEDEENKP